MSTLAEIIAANQNKAAPATPALQSGIPVMGSAAPATMAAPLTGLGSIFTKPFTPAAAPAMPALGGGSRMAQIKLALATARTGSNRNDLVLGTAWYLLKNAIYKETETKKRKITTFSLHCIHAVSDVMGLPATSPSYSGPRVGEEYETAIFQDGAYPNVIINQNVSALQAVIGWSNEKLKSLQTTDEGQMLIVELLKALVGVSILDGVPTGQPCTFANQVVVEIKDVKTMKDQKDNQGQFIKDAAGNKTQKPVVNTYWQKRVSLAEVAAVVPEADIIKAFGSVEAVQAAVTAEQALAQLC